MTTENVVGGGSTTTFKKVEEIYRLRIEEFPFIVLKVLRFQNYRLQNVLKTDCSHYTHLLSTVKS